MIRDDLRVPVAALSFAPNSAAAFPFSVPVTGNFPMIFSNRSSKALFAAGEGCTLKLVQGLMPYQFGNADVDNYIDLQVRVTGVGLQAIPELSPSGLLNLPDWCGQEELDINIAAPKDTNGNFWNHTWRFELIGISATVATIGAPANFDGHTLHPNISLIVLHTLGLT